MFRIDCSTLERLRLHLPVLEMLDEYLVHVAKTSKAFPKRQGEKEPVWWLSRNSVRGIGSVTSEASDRGEPLCPVPAFHTLGTPGARFHVVVCDWRT
jgi:hypothetical protein